MTKEQQQWLNCHGNNLCRPTCYQHTNYHHQYLFISVWLFTRLSLKNPIFSLNTFLGKKMGGFRSKLVGIHFFFSISTTETSWSRKSVDNWLKPIFKLFNFKDIEKKPTLKCIIDNRLRLTICWRLNIVPRRIRLNTHKENQFINQSIPLKGKRNYCFEELYHFTLQTLIYCDNS